MAQVLVAFLVLWKLYQFTHAQRTYPLFLVTAALLTVLLTQTVPALVGPETFSAVMGNKGYRIFDAVGPAVALFFASLFFQSSARAATLTRRRVQAEVALLIVMIIATVVVTAVSSPAGASGGPSSGTQADFGPGAVQTVLAIYVVSNLYYLWALVVSVRAATSALLEATGALKVGLGLAAAGFAVTIVGVASRLTVGSLVAGNVPGAFAFIGAPFTAIGIGLIAFYLGVSLPGLWTRMKTAPVWLRRRRRYRELASMSELFATLFPEMSFLPVARYNILARMGVLQVGWNFYRRVIEIHDGLMLLSTYLDPDEVTVSDDPVYQAGLLQEALERMRDGWLPGEYAVDMGIAREADTVDSDGDALVQVARELSPSALAYTASGVVP